MDEINGQDFEDMSPADIEDKKKEEIQAWETARDEEE